jgi:hypothetical protein
MATTTRSGTIFGSAEGMLSHRDLGYAGKRSVVMPGDMVVVRGWAYDPAAPITAVFAVVGTERHPLKHGLFRSDLVNVFGAGAAQAGFEGAFGTSAGLAKTGTVLVNVSLKDGSEETLEPVREWVTPSSPLELQAIQTGGSTPGRLRFVRDTLTDGYPFGWSGRRTIRRNTLLHAEGWMVAESGRAPDRVLAQLRNGDHAWVFATDRIADGEATALFPQAERVTSGFRLIADTREFQPGLYELRMLAEFGADLRTGPSASFQIAPALPYAAPLFLPVAFEAAQCAIEQCAPLDVLAGEPIAIKGYAIDPATRSSGRVYVAFDDYPPMPIASELPRGDLTSLADPDAGFAGIADTGDIPPGKHVLRILLLNPQSALWYELSRTEVTVRATG